MLDQLIESRSHAEENAKRGGFLLATFFLAAIMLLSGVLWSLFAKDLTMGNENLELSTMVAPVSMPEDAPPAPLKKEEKSVQPQIEKAVTPTRQSNTARIDEMQPAPTEISVSPNTQKARPIGDFFITNGKELDPQGSLSANIGRETTGGDGLSQNSETGRPEIVEKIAPPVLIIKKKVEEAAAQKPKTIISGLVVNGKATSLPKPVYSAAAIAINARGDVNVQVLIDEKGNVISAKAVSGHPLLRDSAERAARIAKFTPTVLSNQPVKVTGIIVYKFLK
ncbi:MAG: energy transducer TonB [Pyrinomonadaceae bacterium]|nr:energy transducer TonB [Pyrinomonadaceae bacterium]